MSREKYLGVAAEFLSTRLTVKTAAQEKWLRYTPCDEVMSIRQTVQVETIGLTERAVRDWADYLQRLLREETPDQAEVNATCEILARSVLPVTATLALRNHWRFSSPASAFTAFWGESVTAVRRFDPARGRMRFAAFMQSTLSKRAQAVADDAEAGEGKVLERIHTMLGWLDALNLTPGHDPHVIFERIQDAVRQDDTATYFTTLTRVENVLEVIRMRGSRARLLSIDFTEDEESACLIDTLASDEEAHERSRLLQAVSPVLNALEDEGLLEDVFALPQGALHELLEATAQGEQWLAPMAVVLGVDLQFATRVTRLALPFYKSA